MTHKIHNGKCPENLQDRFAKRSQISSYSTRNSRDLHLPKPRLEFTKNSFQFTRAFTWNEIQQQQHGNYPLSSSLQKRNETASEKLRWIVAIKHDPLEEYTFFFYKNTWFQFQPAVSYFSVYFQPKVFLILFLIFVFEFPEQSSVKT